MRETKFGNLELPTYNFGNVQLRQVIILRKIIGKRRVGARQIS